MPIEGARGRILSDDQRAQLRQRLASASTRRHPVIARRPAGAAVPLSFAQEQLWFVSQLEALAAYGITLAVPLAGPLDAGALSRALDEIVRRHESLRTVFAADGSDVSQVVLPAAPCPLAVDDLSGLSAGEAQSNQTISRRLFAEAPFDLTTGPLFAARLLRLERNRYELLLRFHHIIADGWSTGVIVQELARVYGAFVAGRPSPLTDAPLQYGDYAVWQRERFTDREVQRLLAYWQPRLAGSRAAELLPDHRRTVTSSFRAATAQFVLAPATAAAVHVLARASGATLFITLLAAFKVLLYRYSGQKDDVVGTVAANRARSELHGTVGCFANLLPLRLTLDGAMTFRALLATVRDDCLGAFEHQEMPFGRLVQECAPDRSAGRNPFFQIAFSAVHAAAHLPGEAGVTFGPAFGVSATVRFDVEVQVSETPDATTVALAYDTELFDPGTIAEMARSFEALIEGVAANPDSVVDGLPLLHSTSAGRVELASRGQLSTYPRDLTLDVLFANAAGRHPDAIAVQDDTTRWTYGELANRAHRLARVLRDRGVGPNVAVGVWLDRGAPLVSAIVGITCAGGTYVPLDRKQPAARASDMLRDVGATVVVTSEALAATVPDGPWQIIRLDALGAVSSSAIASTAHADDLAYVIFTSGSTGHPKGVAVPQRAVARLVCDTDYVELGPQTVMAQAATVAFDAATFEIWGALLNGGRLVIVPTEVALSPASLGAYLQRTGITTLFLTTALVHQIGRESPAALNSVEDVLFGGEAVEPRWIAAIKAAGGPRRLLHVYGPTETTTFASWFPVNLVSEDDITIPIGGPIAQTDLFVLDPSGQLAPPRMPGELYIGGDGLARCYVGAARLTAARFVPDAVTGAFGARLYRTGDRVRWREPGALEFLGRRDGQVKIRGNRIELGEVEAALCDLPGVAAAVVVVHGEHEDRRLGAYVTPLSGAELGSGELREALKARLPAFMLPATVSVLPVFPLNANGKVDRAALPPPEESRPAGAVVLPRSALEDRIAAVWRDVLGVDHVGVLDNFFDLGGHSLLLVRVQAALQSALGVRLPLVALFECPTVATLAVRVSEETAPPDTPPSVTRTADDIAIIGVAGRFPGAPDVETFWQNLRSGRESIHRFSRDELIAAGLPPALVDDPHYVPSRGALADPDLFDADLFGYSPREAALLDPQQRLMLECAWTALERAGYAPRRRSHLRIGVYAGTSANTYIAAAAPAALGGSSPLQVLVASDKDFLATRVSYKLELSGPAVTVQTACSTSLVAVHTACHALRAGECDIALAGGVAVTVPTVGGYRYTPDGIVSPDGHCRPFDAQAAGTVAGNGVGVVVLKPLSKARADGDHVLAVIRGSAVNNDGADKVGFTAPSVNGQAAVIAAAQAAAGVGADTITYVEAHGTGTALGDPVEVAALRRVFGDGAGPATCALASVKSNLGHLDAAAGVTALIKVAMALTHRELPPSLHFTSPNPQLDLGPFYVPSSLAPWAVREGIPRRAGVSSFGMGGTNAHVIVEEAPPCAASGPARPWHIVPVSGQSATALDAVSEQLAGWLEANPDAPAADVAFTQQLGRASLRVRRAAVGQDASALAAALRSAPSRTVSGSAPPLVWLFPGQGTQLVGMGRALYESEPVFRADMDASAAVLDGLLDRDLRSVLFPETADAEGDASTRLSETTWTQVALVAVELGLAALWRSWGVVPDAVIGHSVGELAAACVAGALTRESALQLAVTRGRLMQDAPPGGMVAVAANVDEIGSQLGPDLWLAAVNSATQCVVAGAWPSLEVLEARLRQDGRLTQRLSAAGAFHSGLMAGVVGPLTAAAEAHTASVPQVPWISTVTGDVIADAPPATYWGAQVTAPVQWAAAIAQARAVVAGAPVWLELGPGHTLTRLVQPLPGETTIATLDRVDAAEATTAAVAEAWVAGIDVDWLAYHTGTRRHRMPLPTYPFQRQRYWLDPAPRGDVLTAPIGKRPEISEWLYAPTWKQLPVRRVTHRGGEHCLVFANAASAGRRFKESLEERGCTVTVVEPGAGWREHSPERYEIDPAAEEDCAKLFERLERAGRVPARIVHAWTMRQTSDSDPMEAVRAADSIIHVVQEIARRSVDRRGVPARQRLIVVTAETQMVRGDESVSPSDASVAGLCRIIPQEHPHLECRCVDVERRLADAEADLSALANELAADVAEAVVALRAGRRWIQHFDRIPASATDARPPTLSDGPFLITGGLGRIGLAIAEHVARTSRAKLVLLSRSAVPAKAEWTAWLQSHPQADATSTRIRRLQAIEEHGGGLLVAAADVCDRRQLEDAVALAESQWGPIRGVIHAAGATAADDFAPLAATDRALIERQFLPKVAAAAVLADMFGSRPLDFCILMSSLSSVVGGFGFGAYAAANESLNRLAEREASLGRPWISVAWDGWQFGESPLRTLDGLSSLAMSPAEGLAAFDRILNTGWRGTVVVSTADLTARIAQATAAPAERAAQAARPAMRVPFGEPRTGTEQTVARVWANALGIDRVGVDDNFFELGGHSLLGVHLAAQVSQELGIRLSLHDVLGHPTVAELSRVADRLNDTGDATAGTVARALEAVHQMSEEDIERLLAGS